MLKPLAKKSIVFPSPHSCFEEWNGVVLRDSRNFAASRIQHRYRTYKERVKSLLKRKNQSSRWTRSKESSMEGKYVTCSMVLGLVCSRSEGNQVVRRKYRICNTETKVTSSIQHNPCDVAAVSIESIASDLSSDDEAIVLPHLYDSNGITLIDIEDEDIGHGFVNVIDPKWMVATIEERCAWDSYMARKKFNAVQDRHGFFDIRSNIYDIIFVFRSGHDKNLFGSKPSTSRRHQENIVNRLRSQNEEDFLSRHESRVHLIFESLKSDMAMPAVRCLGWMLSKVWRLLFDGLHVDHDSILGVKKLISSCDPNTRIVFAPTHKTHLDYLIVSYLCFAYGISLPRIAAGNNLDLPLVGSFLRANGSIFIRRSFKDDDLYKKVLKNYVHELMEDGNPIEVFIEAGRSRHGRVCKPRLGFLSMFLDYATSSGDSKDVLIVPISLDYDKVLEVNDYSNQLLGKKKKKESLWGLLCSVSKLFFLRCGHAYVRFGEPISVKNSFSIEKTAHLVSCQLQKCGTVTSTCIIASILMWKRIGLTLAMIEARAKWLLSVLRIKRTSVAPMNENVLALHALDILNVKIVDGNIRFDIASPSRALELSFYRNHLLREFLPDMAVIGALQAHIVPTGESSFNVNNMLNTAEFIWKYLTHVCQHNNVYLREELLRISESTNGLYNDKNLILIHSDDWRTNKYISFTSSLLWPFIESLWLASLSLWLLENEGCSERELISKMQCLGRNLLSKNLLYYPEALCQETLKQSLEYLAQLHFVSRYHETNSKNTYMLYPGENYCTENKLPNLTSKINNIRKPKSFLWKQPEAPCNICGDEVLSLMKKDFVLNRK